LIVGAPEAPLARFLRWYAARLGIGPDDATALVGGLAHDPLLRDAFAPLVAGGRVCVPAARLLRDPVSLGRFFTDNRVTVLHLTPSLGRMLATAGVALPDVRLAVFAGERLTGADVAAAGHWLPRATLINGYGTTETPQLQAVHAIDAAGDAARADVPVGRGVGGTELHVLRIGPDGRPDPGRPAAVGELGEVAIRGRNLADGYTDPGPTAARFAHNGEVSDRLFHTGDLGRYDADGRVVLAGRRDGQVKIRGHRVELGEVEAVLAAHPDVAQAAATVHTIGGEPRLVAYAVPTRAGVPAAALRDFAAAALPEHARPADVVLLAAMPLTRNGKLDRDALPPPTSRPTVVTHTEPATPTERTVAAIWCQVLGLPRASVTANFFDIGGHSLAVVAVQARIRAALDRHVEVVDLFRFPTVRDLAGHLDGGQRAAGLDRADRRIAAQRDRRARAHRPVRPTSTGPTTT
jgi:acyl-CoA synthetase (AMP-forming)/AMP-acid ligase II